MLNTMRDKIEGLMYRGRGEEGKRHLLVTTAYFPERR